MNGEQLAAGAAQQHDLDALGVVGLRMSDLGHENVACCGDCAFLSLHRGAAICARGYTTTVYATRAATCPEFSVRLPLPDVPQGDERTHKERRAAGSIVAGERRSRHDRRQRSA